MLDLLSRRLVGFHCSLLLWAETKAGANPIDLQKARRWLEAARCACWVRNSIYTVLHSPSIEIVTVLHNPCLAMAVKTRQGHQEGP